jgi:regulatory protein
MARKDVPPEVAERVLDRFVEVGLIDDEEYARMLVRTRHGERGLSRRAIGVELRRRGIDDELAAAALEEVDDEDEERAARTLVARRLASTAGLDPAVRARRTFAALGRRGYPPGLVSRLVREALASEGAELADGNDLG